jgi:nicotinate-nucleotide adenylyltransferase
MGHLIVAQHMAAQTDLNEVWLVVSPHNPLKSAADLATDTHRLAMVKMATEGNPLLLACDIEFSLSKPSYTCHTLRAVKNDFPNNAFTLILGEDNLASFHLWKEYEYILENFEMLIFPRHNAAADPGIIDWKKYNVKMVAAPRIEISSTHVRELIKQQKSILYLTLPQVEKYIVTNNLYR